jgi:hypothetical protein
MDFINKQKPYSWSQYLDWLAVDNNWNNVSWGCWGFTLFAVGKLHLDSSGVVGLTQRRAETAKRARAACAIFRIERRPAWAAGILEMQMTYLKIELVSLFLLTMSDGGPVPRAQNRSQWSRSAIASAKCAFCPANCWSAAKTVHATTFSCWLQHSRILTPIIFVEIKSDRSFKPF